MEQGCEEAQRATHATGTGAALGPGRTSRSRTGERLGKAMGLRKARVHTPSRVDETHIKNRGLPWVRKAESERTRASKEQEEAWSKWAYKLKISKAGTKQD